MSGSTHADHRVVPRHSGHTLGPLHVEAEPAGLRFAAAVRDISILGIGLLADQQLAAGTDLLVQAGPAGQYLPAKLKAQVRHATRLPGGQWLLGCSFSRHLTTDDVEQMG